MLQAPSPDPSLDTETVGDWLHELNNIVGTLELATYTLQAVLDEMPEGAQREDIDAVLAQVEAARDRGNRLRPHLDQHRGGR